ncbi:MAG: eamA-like transporter family protein [Clostridiales bacterium]|jgi:transporter family-2 protein|nr:eamA-like transporter family protein [Clostridiales bacterium]
MFYVIISIISGVTIVLARIINSNLGKKIGNMQGTFINYITGVVTSGIFLIIFRNQINFPGNPLQITQLWIFFGGFVGVLCMVIANYITPRMSSLYLTLLVFIGQLFTGLLVDYFTMHELSVGKFIGGLLVFAGFAYNSIVDKKKKEATE